MIDKVFGYHVWVLWMARLFWPESSKAEPMLQSMFLLGCHVRGSSLASRHARIAIRMWGQPADSPSIIANILKSDWLEYNNNNKINKSTPQQHMKSKSTPYFTRTISTEAGVGLNPARATTAHTGQSDVVWYSTHPSRSNPNADRNKYDEVMAVLAQTRLRYASSRA